MLKMGSFGRTFAPNVEEALDTQGGAIVRERVFGVVAQSSTTMLAITSKMTVNNKALYGPSSETKIWRQMKTSE